MYEVVVSKKSVLNAEWNGRIIWNIDVVSKKCSNIDHCGSSVFILEMLTSYWSMERNGFDILNASEVNLIRAPKEKIGIGFSIARYQLHTILLPQIKIVYSWT